MARVSTYLNFQGNAEVAFNFYKEVFNTEFSGEIMRIGDGPTDDCTPPLTDAEQRLIMHIELPILGGHVIMATDMLESMGHKLAIGNNVTINLEPDTRDETDRLYNALAAGGTDASGMQEMFWGAYWGCVLDRFGIRWMFNFMEPVPEG